MRVNIKYLLYNIIIMKSLIDDLKEKRKILETSKMFTSLDIDLSKYITNSNSLKECINIIERECYGYKHISENIYNIKLINN